MFGFIKNWIKPKSFKEVKKEYKKTKDKWIEVHAQLDDEIKAAGLASEIMSVCFGGLRAGQEDCPPLIIHCYKKLLELGADDEIYRCTNLLGMYLSETQQQDFMNKVSQHKEYKEYKEKNRIKKLQEDF